MPNKKEHDDILEQARERFKLASEADKEERTLADDDVRFATNDEGCQWPSELRKEREDDDRPCLVNNKIPEKIDQVDGEFKQLQPSFKIRAVDSKADPKTAEIIGGLMRHIEYNSDARTAYNTAHTSTLYSGRGAWRFDIVDSEEDPFVKDLIVNRIPNVLTVYWDPFSKQANKSDMNYCFVTEIESKEEFKKDHKDVVENWPDGEQWDDWKNDNGYRVAEYWWKEKTKKTYYRVERIINGVPTILSTDTKQKYDIIKEEKTVDAIKVRWCKMVAKQIIDGPHDWPTSDIPIFLELGKEINIRGKSKTRGMTRFAKDPMRMYNYWSSTVTEQVALSPKSPYIATSTQIGQYLPMWQQAHKKNYSVLLYEPDPMAAGSKPYREPPPMMSSAYQHEFMRLEHDIMSAMGIYAASLGDVDSKEQSGRAIMARQRQGNTGSYPYTDSFNIAYTYSCKAMIKLIPHVYDTERIVRIVGEDGQEDMVPINARPELPQQQGLQLPEKLQAGPREGITQYLNDITVGKYDVAVSIGPSYTTQREETLAILMDLLKANPAAAQAVMDLVASNMDIPKHSEELVKRLRKMVPIGIRELEPGEEPPQPQPDPKVMLEMAKLQLDKEIKEAQLNLDEYKAQMKAAADLMTAESKEAGQQHQQIIQVAEMIRKMVEQQHGIQHQTAQQGHEMEMGQRDMGLKEKAAQAAQMAPQEGV